MSARRAWIEGTIGLHYGLRGLSEGLLASLEQSFPANTNGNMIRDEGSTGARGEIGIIPDFDVFAIVSDDPRAIQHALANALTAEEFSIHHKITATGKPLRFDLFPNATLQEDWNLLSAMGITVDYEAVEVNPDAQHAPHPLFVSFLQAIYDKNRTLADSLLTEMKFWTGALYIQKPLISRNGGLFIVNPDASINDLRGAAWTLCWIFQTLAAIQLFIKTFGGEDEYEASYVRAVEANAAYYKAKYIVGDLDESAWAGGYFRGVGFHKNALGVASLSYFSYGASADKLARIGMFQQDFLASVWGFGRGLVDRGTMVISDQAKRDIIEVSDFFYSLIVAMCGDGTNGAFDIRRIARYEVAIGFIEPDGSVKPFASLTEMAANNERDLPPLPPFAIDKALRYHDGNALHSTVGPIGDGYAADFIPAIALAARDNYPGAREGWARLKTLDDWRDGRQTLAIQYNILPPDEYIEDPLTGVTPAPAPQPAPAPTPAPSPVPAPAPVGTNPPAGTKLADEGKPFTLYEPALVSYGASVPVDFAHPGGVVPAGEYWFEKTLPAGNYVADNATFGDTVGWIVKAAWMGSKAPLVPVGGPPMPPTPADPPPATPPPVPPVAGSWKFVGGEGTISRVAPNTLVRYGGNGKYREFVHSGIINIGNSWLGDAAPGEVKHLDQFVVGAAESDPPPPLAPPDLSIYDKTTKILTDDSDMSQSVHGSFVAQQRHPTYVHTLAYPAGFPDRPKKPKKALPPGTGWREIPSTSLSPVMSPELGQGGLYSATADWAGGAWLRALRTFVQVPGGGHLGNDNSTFYGFDADALEAFEFYPPSPLQNPTAPGDHAPGPEYVQASHFYGSPEAIQDSRDGRWKVFLMSGFNTILFDPVGKTLEYMAPYQHLIGTSEGYGWTGGRACGDNKRGIVWYHTTTGVNQLSHFEPGRNRWFSHCDPSPKLWYGGQARDIGYYSHMRINPDKDELVSLGVYDGLLTLDLGSVGNEAIDLRQVKLESDFPEIFPKDSTGALISGSEMSFDWDSKHKDFVVYARTGIFSMDPNTFKLTKLGEGGPVPEHNGCWGRFWYDADDDDFKTFPTISSNVWSFKR